MELDDVKKLAEELIVFHKLDWKFKFDNAKKRFGVTKYRTKTISLSRHLCQLNTVENVRDTILHEIAHALAGPKAGHGIVWKKIAKEIGASTERCYSIQEVVVPKAKWNATCPSCKRVITRHRKTDGLSCGVCCGRTYNPQHKFSWELAS